MGNYITVGVEGGEFEVMHEFAKDAKLNAPGRISVAGGFVFGVRSAPSGLGEGVVAVGEESASAHDEVPSLAVIGLVVATREAGFVVTDDAIKSAVRRHGLRVGLGEVDNGDFGRDVAFVRGSGRAEVGAIFSQIRLPVIVVETGDHFKKTACIKTYTYYAFELWHHPRPQKLVRLVVEFPSATLNFLSPTNWTGRSP